MRPLLLLLFSTALATAAPVVTNHEDGSTVRYPVVLLRGTVDAGTETLELRNTATGNDPRHQFTSVHDDGRFKALVKLAPGANTLGLRAGPDAPATTLTLHYKPSTNPHYVRLVWMTDSAGDTSFAVPTKDTPQTYKERLQTAALLMQTFTAERLHDLGYGRHTFTLETGPDGLPVVHTLAAPETAEHYYNIANDRRWWGDVHRWLDREHRDPFAKNMVLAAFTRKDPETGKMKAHTALGGGALGLFGSGSVFSWPQSIAEAETVFADPTRVDPANVHDDSAGRGVVWGLASTTIGATLHEMGHAFDLPHCTDGLGIMTRGFDHFHRAFTFADPPSRTGLRGRDFTPEQEAYFAPVSASYLRWSRWFQPDRVDYPDDKDPVITYHHDTGKVVVESDHGVRWVGLWSGPDIHNFKEYPDKAPTSVTIEKAEVDKLLAGKPLSVLTAIADNGRPARLNLNR